MKNVNPDRFVGTLDTIGGRYNLGGPPAGLVELGYFTSENVAEFRRTGLRAWHNGRISIPATKHSPAYHNVYVEPWVLKMRDLYRNMCSKGHMFGGLSEWEFIVAAIPDKKTER